MWIFCSLNMFWSCYSEISVAVYFFASSQQFIVFWTARLVIALGMLDLPLFMTFILSFRYNQNKCVHLLYFTWKIIQSSQPNCALIFYLICTKKCKLGIKYSSYWIHPIIAPLKWAVPAPIFLILMMKCIFTIENWCK